jgi:2-amino-4-hydroxy-6-hydroxymethyldihydropteridine diphosphokinase
MNRIVLLTGSNIGDCQSNLKKANELIEEKIGKITALSSIYMTAAWGNTEQDDFLNQVLVVDSALSPMNVLDQILAIERHMGRVRTIKNAPRLIDIDILFFNQDAIQEKELEIPHPLIGERRFVLEPLNELMAEEIHPVSGKKIKHMLIECSDPLVVRKK